MSTRLPVPEGPTTAVCDGFKRSDSTQFRQTRALVQRCRLLTTAPPLVVFGRKAAATAISHAGSRGIEPGRAGRENAKDDYDSSVPLAVLPVVCLRATCCSSKPGGVQEAGLCNIGATGFEPATFRPQPASDRRLCVRSRPRRPGRRRRRTSWTHRTRPSVPQRYYGLG